MGVVGDEIKPRQCSRVVLGFDEEIEKDLVDVLDLIEPLFHDIFGAHEGGDVTADAQAALVSILRGGGHPFRLKRVIDLDLRVAALGVPVDGFLDVFDI